MCTRHLLLGNSTFLARWTLQLNRHGVAEQNESPAQLMGSCSGAATVHPSTVCLTAGRAALCLHLQSALASCEMKDERQQRNATFLAVSKTLHVSLLV